MTKQKEAWWVPVIPVLGIILVVVFFVFLGEWAKYGAEKQRQRELLLPYFTEEICGIPINLTMKLQECYDFYLFSKDYCLNKTYYKALHQSSKDNGFYRTKWKTLEDAEKHCQFKYGGNCTDFEQTSHGDYVSCQNGEIVERERW